MRIETKPVVQGQPLRGWRLKDVVNDTKARAFCGPTAVAAISHQPISVVRDAYRTVRHGPDWPDFLRRSPLITGTSSRETEGALRLLGFRGYWTDVIGRPTLARYLEQRSGEQRTAPCIVMVTGHWIAVCGWTFVDTRSDGFVVDAELAPGRRTRVHRVFVVTGAVSPGRITSKTRTR